MDIGGLWEVAEYCGETLVFVGVVGEVLAERRLIFAENQLRRDAMEGLSSWILIVGLAVSLAALMGTNERFNKTIADLTRQAAESNREAGEAHARAALANERSQQLENSTQKLKTDAEEAHKEAGVERLARVKLEQRLAWRRIDRKTHTELVARLKPYAGSVVLVRLVSNGDPETEAFAEDILKVFQESGWRISGGRVGIMIPSPLGLTCAVNEGGNAGKAAAAVCRELPGATIAPSSPPEGVAVLLTIGPRPPA